MADHLAVMRSYPPDKPKGTSPSTTETGLSASELHKKISAYLNSLDKIPKSAWTKTVDKKSLLELLDPSINSIPYLKCLSDAVQTLGKQDAERAEVLFNQACIFFASFDPVPMRYVGDMWHDLWVWTHLYMQANRLLDQRILSTALLRLDPSAATFTTLHLRFVRQCLAAGTPSQALPILDQSSFAYPQTLPKNVPAEPLTTDYDLSNAFIHSDSGFTEKINPEHVLEYYLLGAHVYIGTRNHQRARLFLEHVILHPTQHNTASTLQVEAYKKWLLIGLLSEGKKFPYPSTLPTAVWKSLDAAGIAYVALVNNFQNRDTLKYQAELEVGAQIWNEDGNLGLVTEAGRSLVRYCVADLQKTYAALPVAKVAFHLGYSAEDTLTMLTHMIKQSSLNASLAPGATAGEAILRFNLASSANTATQQLDLESQTKRIEKLIAAVRDADRRLQLTKEHVALAKRNKNTPAPDADLADQMDLSWDPPGTGSNVPLLVGDDDDDDEEDIMS
jgi:COP9 signalosome complex subunit 3